MKKLPSIFTLSLPVLLSLLQGGSHPLVAQAGPPLASAVTLTRSANGNFWYTDRNTNAMDLHDGKIFTVGSFSYMIGTQYGTDTPTIRPDTGSKSCTFYWNSTGPNAGWCGFGEWFSSNGTTWTYLGELFDPNGINSAYNETWMQTCNYQARGCFEPRLVQRSWDGVWVLWFEVAGDAFRGRPNSSNPNSYYIMGCNGYSANGVNDLCGSNAGGPHGSTHKPNLTFCNSAPNSPASSAEISNIGGTAYLVCAPNSNQINIEQLNTWWADGSGSGKRFVGGVGGGSYPNAVESGSIIGNGSRLFLTYSYPGCGYCGGTGTNYLYSDQGPLGTWTQGGQVSFSNCSGQPNALNWFGGTPVQWIDQWSGPSQAGPPYPPQANGQPNQTLAPILLETVSWNTYNLMNNFQDCP